jgi:2-dehydropantoate 2-reductase
MPTTDTDSKSALVERMRILVVGAGAVGGYFGGRLLESGADVTFLVRPPRAAALAANGLVIKSPTGDATLPAPPTILAEALQRPYDLVLLSCKAYDLEGAMTAFAPAVGSETKILPLLNGLRHLAVLDDRFGSPKVLGGLCAITATLDPQGAIVLLSPYHSLVFGEQNGELSNRIRAIAAVMAGAHFEARASSEIILEMWEKWVFLAALAGSTSLLRATVGDINAVPGGREFMLDLIEECRAVAKASRYEPRPDSMKRTRALLTAADSNMTGSMFRDIERNSAIEADQIIGDLIRRASADSPTSVATPLLRIINLHLRSYETRRKRDAADKIA